jgi:hypothetical protein
MPKAVPTREVPIAGGTVLPAGALFLVNGKVVVNPIAQTAAALLASVGGTTLTTCSVADRWGAFPDTGLPIFAKPRGTQGSGRDGKGRKRCLKPGNGYRCTSSGSL